MNPRCLSLSGEAPGQDNPYPQRGPHHSWEVEGAWLPWGSGFHRETRKAHGHLRRISLGRVRILYTTNCIERLMGEVSKRCKHKWMHWSTSGLKNILSIILVRYTNEAVYTAFKNAIFIMRLSSDVHSRILSYNCTAPKYLDERGLLIEIEVRQTSRGHSESH